MSTAALMDRIYLRQRHIYDATRKFYLLGRDGLVQALDPPERGSILEIGCGTARNLVAIARTYPTARCYGLDVSSAMLATARRSVDRAGLSDRIHLAEGDAGGFDAADLFGIALFDRVMISYALSMMPAWQDVLQHAGRMVAAGGSLHVVDFGDQARLPRVFRRVLHAWLARFHVTPRLDLPRAIERLARDNGMRASTRSLFRGYALSAVVAR